MPTFTNEVAKRCSRWLLQSTAPSHLKADHPVKDDLAASCDEIERLQAQVRVLQERPVNMVTYNVITFGFGLYGVDIGTLGDTPAVFIIPNGEPGLVGVKIPLELQGSLELDKLPNDWTVLTFPTRERCKEVADALVGSKMEKWSRDADDDAIAAITAHAKRDKPDECEYPNCKCPRVGRCGIAFRQFSGGTCSGGE